MDSIQDLQKEIGIINDNMLDLVKKQIGILDKYINLCRENKIQYNEQAFKSLVIKEFPAKQIENLPHKVLHEYFLDTYKILSKYMGVSDKEELLVSKKTGKYRSMNEICKVSCEVPAIIAGPCSVENMEYIEDVAMTLKKFNLKYIRGGAYKPRTSPYDFQGLKKEGLQILKEICGRYNLVSVSEIVDTRDIELFSEYIDVFQIGSRNMQNYELLKEVGKTDRPVLLKNGMNSTIQEFIYAAEYIAVQGNENIILCERGIRTNEVKTRNTLDVSAIPILKEETVLPVIADLSHSLGRKDILNVMAKAVLAAGADGIMVEVHPYPELALSDSKQQLNINEFVSLLNVLGYQSE